MSDVKFQYDIKISSGTEFIKHSQIGDNIPNANEMIILSHYFSNYDECQRSLKDVLGFLSRSESSATSKNFVIVTKVNPLIDATEKLHRDASTWDRFTIMRAYVADSQKLKDSKLQFSILGQIKADHEIVRRVHRED